MKKILIMNGPNLNLLGTREPEKYGTTTLAELEKQCKELGERLGFEIETFQSNHEGALIDKIHEAGLSFKAGKLQGIVFNPGAYTHTSIALHDAIVGVGGLPLIEVHISNVHAREPFRHHSYVSPAAQGIVIGFGTKGYLLGIEQLAANK